MTSIIDDIGKVVQAMRDLSVKPNPIGTWTRSYDDSSLVQPFYFNGRRKEIINAVANKEKLNSVKIFPMIALNGDFQYTRRGTLVDYKLNLLLAVATKQELSTEEREEQNYVPILYPLYDLFINTFANIGLFQWDATGDLYAPPHQPINRYYYGANNSDGNIKNMFAEPVDAIELVELAFSRDLNN